jgi:membrane-associated phospholipid phosphatase
MSVIWGVIFSAASVLINHIASVYATLSAGNPVGDILLDNIPVMNVDFIVNEGAIIFLVFVFLLLLNEPKRIPFTLKGVAIFYIVRSIFLVMTHIGPFPTQSYLDPTDLLYRFNIGGDFFFSGHTGLPFLVALIFWDEKNIRIVALITSVVFGISVIVGHLHYSIDVFAAFFITYGIFHITRKAFISDYQMLVQGAKAEEAIWPAA